MRDNLKHFYFIGRPSRNSEDPDYLPQPFAKPELTDEQKWNKRLRFMRKIRIEAEAEMEKQKTRDRAAASALLDLASAPTPCVGTNVLKERNELRESNNNIDEVKNVRNELEFSDITPSDT